MGTYALWLWLAAPGAGASHQPRRGGRSTKRMLCWVYSVVRCAGWITHNALAQPAIANATRRQAQTAIAKTTCNVSQIESIDFIRQSVPMAFTDTLLAGAAAGFWARALTAPLDVVKIRMQLQIEPIAMGAVRDAGLRV
jgi:hypothetical protein